MITQAAQDNAAIALDWITGVLAFVTAVMAIATVVLGIKTAASVKVAKESVLVAKQEADATLELGRGRAKTASQQCVRCCIQLVRAWAT